MIHTLKLHESASDVVSELFKELVDLTRQINHLRAKLEAAQSPSAVLRSHKQLIAAKELRTEVMAMLELEFDQPVTLENFMLNILTNK